MMGPPHREIWASKRDNATSQMRESSAIKALPRQRCDLGLSSAAGACAVVKIEETSAGSFGNSGIELLDAQVPSLSGEAGSKRRAAHLMGLYRPGGHFLGLFGDGLQPLLAIHVGLWNRRVDELVGIRRGRRCHSSVLLAAFDVPATKTSA
jgi:hypothetical protein